MAQYINKAAIVAEIERRLEAISNASTENNRELAAIQGAQQYELINLVLYLDTLEVKEVGDNSLEKFKSLQHITKDLHKTLEDWGYAPNLYHFDGSWHVDWISCEEGDSIKGFTEDTAEEAINEACNWFHSTFCNG